jgi:putative transposase
LFVCQRDSRTKAGTTASYINSLILDRGSQYCSKKYQALIKKQKLICSMSAKGNPYDNAVAESFFHSMKVELIHGESFDTRKTMRQAVFEYIEVDYNRARRHSANGLISPLAFEMKNVA